MEVHRSVKLFFVTMKSAGMLEKENNPVKTMPAKWTGKLKLGEPTMKPPNRLSLLLLEKLLARRKLLPRRPRLMMELALES